MTEHLEEFSADYWHDVRLELRRRFGERLRVVGLCSPAGDQSPHMLLYSEQELEMLQRRGLTQRQEIAQRVADAVARALACTRPEKDQEWPLTFRTLRTGLAPRRITRAERDWAEKTRAEWIAKKGESQSWWPSRQQAVVDAFDHPRELKPVPVELHVLRLGDMAIATNPFELFLDYGLQIKARSPAAQTMLIQLVGHGMYLPTARSMQGGAYSVQRHSRGFLRRPRGRRATRRGDAGGDQRTLPIEAPLTGAASVGRLFSTSAKAVLKSAPRGTS